MRTPPKHVPPARLFRELCCAGRRPRWRVSFAELGLPDLYVYALAGYELEDLLPIGERVSEERSKVVLDELVVRTLHNLDGSAAFVSVEQLGEARYEDALELTNSALEALNTVSPTYGRSDLTAWEQVLREGAMHPSNATLRRGVIDAAAHLSMTAHFVQQPDRFFGLPLGQLVDAQRIAFDAAWSTRG